MTQDTTIIEHIGNAYDRLPYLSAAFPQSSPARLHAIARLFGLDAPDPATARVLELGCSAGGNLLPFAVMHPRARAVGIDLSPVQVESGRAIVGLLGLDNLELRHMSITDVGPELGEFDYVICHGVYSWVPPEVQEKILDICSRNLSANGVAYVSYNTYPGWKAKEIIRDAMLLRGTSRPDPAENLAYARGMIEFMHEVARPDSVLKKVLDENIGMIRNGQPYYLIHEFLEPCNAPCYFSDFLARAGQHGLCYLGEADLCSMFASNFGPERAAALIRECGQQEPLEQMMDFLTNRPFRQTLLVHDARRQDRRYNLGRERILPLHISGGFHAKAGAGDRPEPDVMVSARNGQSLNMLNPSVKRLVDALNAAFPSSVPVAELAAGDGNMPAIVESLLISGAISVHSTPLPPAPAAIGDRPVAFAALRRLVAHRNDGHALPVALFNRNHETLPALDVVTLALIPLLDGTRTQADLEAEIERAAASGRITFHQDGKALDTPERRAPAIRGSVERALQQLRQLAVLE